MAYPGCANFHFSLSQSKWCWRGLTPGAGAKNDRGWKIFPCEETERSKGMEQIRNGWEREKRKIMPCCSLFPDIAVRGCLQKIKSQYTKNWGIKSKLHGVRKKFALVADCSIMTFCWDFHFPLEPVTSPERSVNRPGISSGIETPIFFHMLDVLNY